MVDVRVLNGEGIVEFSKFLARLREHPAGEVPWNLLDDGRYSDPMDDALSIEQRDFDNAFVFGEYLVSALATCEARVISRNHGLWSWLALFFFDFLCPKNADGLRKPLQDDLYVLQPEFNFRRYYRHLVRTPWQAVRMHDEAAKVLLLSSGRGVRTDLAEQIGGYQELFGSSSVVRAAYELYFNPETQKPKRGAGGKGAGSPRRYSSVLRQLELTYDLAECPSSSLINLLPSEFNSWRNQRV
ncbi:hypothetical protein [Polaromonas jejuensis]|uniref:Uncharacterized protein n=1 Tax=Polaromonas jejuensis TaxID=457502 RepID=A0ABW0QDE6_9BURK|nr:hypothetical protein [Polaromonas jejuensis]